MKRSLLPLVILFFAACNTSTSTSEQGDSTALDSSAAVTEDSGPQEFCFLKTDGLQQQDSTTVHFTIENNIVSGDLNWIPSEKDARKGTLTGTKTGDLIKGTWTFMQEGMTDSLAVEFKLSGETLVQKSYSIDQATGKEYLSDGSEFDREFRKVGCKE